MVIIKTDESAHSLKPEFIRRVIAEGYVKPGAATNINGVLLGG